VKNKWNYLLRAKSAIEDMHKCSTFYLRTQLVDETVGGKTVWIGDVEIFALIGHPKAKHCYAWSRRDGNTGEGERFVAVLEIPPVVSPTTAVRASIVSDAKKGKL
jgi:hypothetical protein